MARTRSFRVGRMRVVRVAMVSQPRPRTMGSTALPLRPMTLNTRSVMTARRGRYPESSSMENTTKKVATMGSTMASP